VAVETAKKAKIASLFVPGLGTSKELREAAELGISVLRIAVHCTEADVTEQYFRLAKELGLETVGFLMMSHTQPASVLAEQAKLMESYGADCVYVVDSAGALVQSGVRERVSALKEALSIQVGFHAHNNLGLAIGNTITALEAGADQIDGTLRGLGAGAGNAPTEVLVAVLNKMKVETGINLAILMDAAEEKIAPLMQSPIVIDRGNLSSGYAGVYNSFLLHVKHAAEKFGVGVSEIMEELGKRQAVAGQEDWILDVAVELAEKKGLKV
jgi:4-hydroxy 2-oxovalerate aldolase